ncbi:hypothetical protein ACNOYE_12290 [Nannocystaceae bacterium ST9]
MTRSPDHEALVAALRRDAPAFALELATLAADRGLAFTNPDGSTRPLAIAATPIILAESALAERIALAHRISSAGVKMARAILRGSDRELLLAGLSPLERHLALRSFESTTTLATCRVDFFAKGHADASPFALEINATIPAMQGYSDIATQTFLEVVGRHWRLSPDRIAELRARNGSNPHALHQALLAGHRAIRPGQTPNAIALLCRRMDAQLGELVWLRDRFRELGSDAEIVHPDQLAGDDAVRVAGKPYDLIYRHIFVRRLEEPGLPGADYLRALLAEPNGTRAVVLNPPASAIEAKLTFALLSSALEDPGLRARAGLDDDELAAIRDAVPWTRAFRDPALAERVAADPDRHVLKRNWDYGGRTVFVGRTRETPGFLERVRATYGEDMDWAQLCARALADREGGGFVVQARVDMIPEPHVMCSTQGHTSLDLYVDFSGFASVGLAEPAAWTGVCRGSTSPVVNLHSGGGLLPLLTAEVARDLAEALASGS